MSRLLLPVGFVLGLGALLTLPAAPVVAAPPQKAEEELVEKVRTSIDAGVRYLKKQQTPQGNWEGIVIGYLADMEGGSTGLVTLALLNCGVPKTDAVVARGVDYLRKLPPKKTYVVALVNMVLAEVRDAKDLPLIQTNAQWLVEHALGWRANPDGSVTGDLRGWSYPANPSADNSNTQYALLGLYAAKQAGAKIHNDVWRGIQVYYSRTQGVDRTEPTSGFWTYSSERTNEKASHSMTVAGVCGLLIARMGLDVNEHELDPATGVAKRCGLYAENSELAKGMNWVAGNFNFYLPSDSRSKSAYYNTYGIERLGRLSGQRFLGTHDWYREGCEKLVGKFNPESRKFEGGTQSPEGSFGTTGQIDGTAHLSTAFALLFLSKGRTPVLVSKFAWGDFQQVGDGTGIIEVPHRDHPAPRDSANWNRKHNDTRHIVDFCSRELFDGAPLSWQVYDARRQLFDDQGAGRGKSKKEKIDAEVGLLLQSPVLYLNGHGPLILTGDQEEILKTYVEEGGFVVAEACCGDPVFAKSFRATMLKLFPDNRFRPMSADHAIWKMFPGVLPTDFPEIEALERGCRTVAVFSPVPLAGYWEESKYMPKDSKHPANRGEKAFCLIRNIVGYATGLEMPKPKLSKQTIERGVETGVTRSHFKAVQLKIAGDPEPAPDALKNLMGFLRDNARLEVALKSAVLPPYDDQIFNFKFMYMHGRRLKDNEGKLVFGEPDIETIQSNLQSGGLLLADAACGGYDQWKAYDKAFRELCAKLFPGEKQKLQVIQEFDADGKEDPLFKVAREAGINLRSVRCRRELPGDKGPEPEYRPYPVLLEGIKIDGRWVVVYSKYDIGCAIEGHKAADCLGHDKESALKIAGAVVLYSLKR